MVHLQTVSADEWTLWRELSLSALEEVPHAFSSTLADWQGDGDYEARWRDRLAAVPFNVVAELDERPAGMVSATGPDADGDVLLMSLWVAPFARGRGVGDSLLEAVGLWAESRGARTLSLDVISSNRAALALYDRHGFVARTGSEAGEASSSELHLTKRLTDSSVAPRIEE
jgi:ribosomal protein S18 acetylase RimI-like enzyme